MWFIPGPVELSEAARLAQARMIIGHRSQGFRDIYKDCAAKLKKVYKTEQNAFILTCSGTGAIECGVLNIVDRGDKVLAIDNGDFGRRLGDQAKLYTDKVEVMAIPYGKGAHLEEVKAKIDGFKPDVVAVVHNDTSTSVENPVRGICAYAHEAGAMTFVDSVSGLAGADLSFDAWKIDVCASAAQKCIGGPAGIGFVAASARAMEKAKKIPAKSTYFSLPKFAKSAEKGETPNTPNISGIFAIQAALDEVIKEGLDARVQRHKDLSNFVQKSLEGMGFELFTEAGYRSSTVTGFKSDKSEEIRKVLSSEYGFNIAGGQADLKGKIARIGNMANATKKDLAPLMEALEAAKKKVGA